MAIKKNSANEQIRLQKYLASCGVASRRKCETYITSGRVAIDGKVTTELGTKVIPGKQHVTFDSKKVTFEETFEYYLLNKPKGYVTTASDPQGRPIVTSLVKDSTTRLFPVGRLDFDTEGALILTNDGQLAQKIQHPKFTTKKTYHAAIYGHPSQSKLTQLESGLMIDGKKTAPAKAIVKTKRTNQTLVEITIHEGRKHQVKKMFKAIGHPVLSLQRISYGRLFLGKLKVGECRQLSSSEIKKIFL